MGDGIRKTIKIQVSNDAVNWTDAIRNTTVTEI